MYSASFHRTVIGSNYGKPADGQSPERNFALLQFTNGNGSALRMDIAEMCGHVDNGIVTLPQQMHNHSLAHDNGFSLIAIRKDAMVEEMKSYAYQSTFRTVAKLLSTLADIFPSGVYAWDSQALTRVVLEMHFQSSSRRLNLVQYNEPEVIETIGDDLGAAVDIRGFKAVA